MKQLKNQKNLGVTYAALLDECELEFISSIYYSCFSPTSWRLSFLSAPLELPDHFSFSAPMPKQSVSPGTPQAQQAASPLPAATRH